MEAVERMGTSSEPYIWEEIETCESYMVCSMYEKAVSLSTSLIERLCHNKMEFLSEAGDHTQLHDMMESTGMVLVQSLKEMGRTAEISSKLKELFGSVAAIPIEVFRIGIILQISENLSGVQELIGEFLSKWSCVDNMYYTPVDSEANISCTEICDGRFLLGVDKYFEVVEIYVLTVLAGSLGEFDLAISWVEKAALPQDRRQDILRRLHSLYSIKATSLSLGSPSSLLMEHEVDIPSEGTSRSIEQKSMANGDHDQRQAILKLYGQGMPSFWFRSINLKLGNFRLVISNAKILMGCLLLLACLVLRRKRSSRRSYIRRQALALKNALVDFWQLAFAFKVNPLAAVQPLASTSARP